MGRWAMRQLTDSFAWLVRSGTRLRWFRQPGVFEEVLL